MLNVKVKAVELHPPIGKHKFYPDLTVSVVSAIEDVKPTGRERIRWTFITNLPVTSKPEGITVLEWYKQRWKIELYLKILKSGFKAEDSKLRTADRLTRLISIFCILAWRIQWITMLNREDERLSSKLAFDSVERKILETYFGKKNLVPKTLQDFIGLVARLGGHLVRAADPPPGNMIIWRGINKLFDLKFGFEMAKNCG